MLNTKKRKNIVREAKFLIKLEIDGFDDLHVGERESILDKYIQRVCEEKGTTLNHFYFEEGKKLEKILGVI
jgi:hypothetical protein